MTDHYDFLGLDAPAHAHAHDTALDAAQSLDLAAADSAHATCDARLAEAGARIEALEDECRTAHEATRIQATCASVLRREAEELRGQAGYQATEVARCHAMLAQLRTDNAHLTVRTAALAAALERTADALVAAGDTIDRLTWLRDTNGAEALQLAVQA